MCMCMFRVVCCACVLKWLCVCVESVCGVCAESVWDVRFVFWCCGVLLCVCCDVLCELGCVLGCVCGVWCVWRGLARGKTVYRQNACMCFNMRAFCQYTQKRFEPTHGDVLNLHTVRREAVLFSLSRPFSLPSSFSLPSFSSFVLFLFLSSLLSVTMTMITRSIGSLCVTHRSDLPECQSAWAVAHSLLAEHVRIMHETTVLEKLCKPRATWNEVVLYLCWKWVLCLVVCGCVSMC